MTHPTTDVTPQRVEPGRRVIEPAGWRRPFIWLAEHELWLLALAVPPLVFPEVVPRRLVLAALVYLAALWVFRWMARGYVSVRTPMDVPITGLLVMLPLSLYASVDLSLSLPKLTGILLGVAVYYAVVNTTQGVTDARQMVLLLIFASGAIAIVGLLGTDWTAKFPALGVVYKRLPKLIHRVPHVYAESAIHPNQLGGMMALFVPFLVSLLASWIASVREGLVVSAPKYTVSDSSAQGWSGRLPLPDYGTTFQDHSPTSFRFFVLLSCLALFLSSFVLVLTQSRSAWFGSLVALLGLAVIRIRWMRFASVVLVLAGIGTVAYLGFERVGTVMFDVGSSTVNVGTLNFAGRMEVWQRAVYMLQDFPYTGIGLNTFPVVANILYPFFLIGPDTKIPHAHNNLLQLGTDLGLPGLVAYCGLFAAFFLTAWQVARSAQTPDLRAVGLGLLCGVLAYHIYGLTDAITLGAKPGLILWAMYGLIAAIYRSMSIHGLQYPCARQSRHRSTAATTTRTVLS